MDKKQLLLEELGTVRKQICDIKADIKEVKTIRFKTGQFESIKSFNFMQQQHAEFVLRQDQITAELSAIKSQKQNLIHIHFMDVCREEIEEDDFLWILKEAKRRTEESALPV